MRILPKWIFLTCAFLALPVFAMSAGVSSSCVIDKCPMMSLDEASALLKPLNLKIKSVKYSPVKGLFEVVAERDGVEGIIFVDCARQHLMQGVITDARNIKATPLKKTHLRQKNLPIVDIKKLPLESSIIMGNPVGSKKLYVFTDPDCPYCRQLHSELIKLEKRLPDVAIYIFLYPQLMHPAAFDKSRAVLSGMKRSDLDHLFMGKEISALPTDAGTAKLNSIIRFAKSQKIKGTPALVLHDGVALVGTKDVDALINMLKSNPNSAETKEVRK
ncbi:MAG TPA: DsbC family protein [Deltaproteobacteria bacterium]|nr:DsbC family protein [Deltaproteobacteria bacterium]HQB39168.1 DsbC family protein [Deltaproteobacteria bacterium]